MAVTTSKKLDWDQLLLRSEELAQDTAIPRVERDIYQIEQFSERLRSKAVRGDATNESLDASRLLAQEGLNPRRLNQALQTFELRPTYEDVLKPETASVNDYLERLHETIAASAVQEAQRSAVAAFESHMDACMAANWAREKRALLDSVEPFSTPASKGFPTTSRSTGGAAATATTVVLRGRAARYAEVVKKLNVAITTGEKYDAVSDFAAAAAAEDDLMAGAVAERRTTMLRVWQVLHRQLEGVYDVPPSARSHRDSLLLAGSRRYLEDNYVAYLQSVVNAHRAQAALGGNPSKLMLVHAYLRVREKDRGPLDIDGPGGAETTWLQVFTCLRAGFFPEAVQAARHAAESTPTSRAAASTLGSGGGLGFSAAGGGGLGLSGRDVPSLLTEWIDGGCRPLSGDAGAAALAECERQLKDRSARVSFPQFAHRAMVFALLAGSNRSVDAIIREFPTFFPTIEDFLWVKLGLVRSGGRSAASTSAGLESFSLSDLQRYLRQYPPSHYSHGGREPLLYAVVLLLSLQGAAAVGYLAKDPSTREARLDAVHVGVCLWHARVIQGGGRLSLDGDLDLGGDAREHSEADAFSVGRLLHQYARSLIHGDVPLALEYYMLACAAFGGSLEVRGKLLRELLAESRAYGLLLGAGGPGGEGGALTALVPDPEERRRVLEAVAAECAAAAQLEEAAELYMAAGRPRAALRIILERLSEAIEESVADAMMHAEEADALTARGNAAVAAIGSSRDSADLMEIEAFEQLKAIRSMMMAATRGDHGRVLQALGELSFVPLERYRVQTCAAGASGVHPAVAARLQAVLLAAAEALAAAGKEDELRCLVAFAAAVPNRVSQAAYQRLNQLQAALA